MIITDLNLDDFGQLIYLVLLLIFVANGFLFRGNLKISQIFKQLVAWSLIVLVIILGYSYRYEFYEIKDRLAAEILPSRAVNKDGQLIIKSSVDGHFYIDVKINDQSLKLMVDTGASDLVLSARDAKKIGIDFNNLQFTRVYQTANGKSYGALVKLEKIDIGEISFNNVYAGVSSGDMGVSLLGMSFLRRFKKYEFHQDQLILNY